MKRTRVIASILLIFLSLESVCQVGPAAPPQPSSVVQQQALAELNQVISDISSLKLSENRILLQVRAGDLLWNYDQARALGLFGAAVGEFSGLMTAPQTERDNRRGWGFLYQLRREVAMTIARRDPRIALDFVRATKAATSGNPEVDQGLELDIAAAVAQSDSRLAAQIAESNANAYPYQFPQVWNSLLQKDPAAAAELSSKMLQKLRGDELVTNRQALSMAMNWLSMIPPPQALAARNQSKTAAMQQQVGSELAKLISAAMANPAAPADMLNNQYLVSKLDTYSPGASAQVQARVAQAGAGNPANAAWQSFNQILQKGNISDALGFAEQAPAPVRSNMYAQIASVMAGKGDMEEAKTVAARITESSQRESALENINRQAAFRAADQDKFDAARQIARSAQPAETAAGMLIQVAGTALSKRRPDIATATLEEARRLLPAQPENQEQLNVFFQLAQAYAAVDPSQSAEILGGISERLNALVPSMQTLDGFMYRGNASFRNGELFMMGGGFGMWGGMFQQLAGAIGRLGSRNFDEANSVVEKVDLPEVRASARLGIVESVLGRTTPPGAIIVRSGNFNF